VTHHAEEIIPEIDRVILLSKGRIAADGVKGDVLRGRSLADAFGAALQVHEADGYFHVRVA